MGDNDEGYEGGGILIEVGAAGEGMDGGGFGADACLGGDGVVVDGEGDAEGGEGDCVIRALLVGSIVEMAGCKCKYES